MESIALNNIDIMTSDASQNSSQPLIDNRNDQESRDEDDNNPVDSSPNLFAVDSNNDDDEIVSCSQVTEKC